jgi:hypothetical protein
MEEMDHIPETKLKAYMLVGAIGVAVILIADLTYMVLHKGLEGIKMIGWF